MNQLPPKPDVPKPPTHAHFIAGWPLLLVIAGGAIGGPFGGLAYACSIQLFKKKGISTTTGLFSFLIGVTGIALYVRIIIALNLAFPRIFVENT